MSRNREIVLTAAAIMLAVACAIIATSVAGPVLCQKAAAVGDRARALCPAAEDNQGLLSALAIAVAFLLYAMELGSARAAEARARRLQRREQAEEDCRALAAWFASANDVLDRAIDWFEFITRIDPEDPTAPVRFDDIENGLIRSRTAWAIIRAAAPVDPALHPIVAEFSNQLAAVRNLPQFPMFDPIRTEAQTKLQNFRMLKRAMKMHADRMMAERLARA